MLRSFLILPLLLVWFGLLAPIETNTPSVKAPLPPDTGVASTSVIAAPIVAQQEVPIEEPPAPASIDDPIRLSIASIGLTSRIIPVGLNALGQMDVPSGKSTDVGWYKFGPRPGEWGSAVLDAHVFAAFSKLARLSVGKRITIETSSHQTLTFEVVAMKTYKLGELTPDMLFNINDGKRLNLITCAGKLTQDHSTYDHRLVIYTKLVE